MPDCVGYGGAALVALAYLFNQRGWLASQDWRYPALNLGGSILIMVSLVFHPNVPSIVIEVFWCAISVYGVVRNAAACRRSRYPAAPP